MTKGTTLTGFFLAVITLIAVGLTSPATQAAPVNSSATAGLSGLNAADRGNVILIQRRRSSGGRVRPGRRAVHRGRRGVRRRTIRRHRRRVIKRRAFRRGVRRGHRWGRRGRRYRRGSRWLYWAPWIGSYVYFDSYRACYRSCRRRGYSRPYCSDLCAR